MTYVGDKAITVFIEEKGHIYDVLVKASTTRPSEVQKDDVPVMVQREKGSRNRSRKLKKAVTSPSATEGQKEKASAFTERQGRKELKKKMMKRIGLENKL